MKKALVALREYKGKQVGDIIMPKVDLDWTGFLLSNGIAEAVEWDDSVLDERFIKAVLIPADEENGTPEHYEIQEDSDAKSAHEDAAPMRSAKAAVSGAISFGKGLMEDFIAENILLGIRSDGMTKVVRGNLREVMEALQTGSLYDAIDEIKNIPSAKKDGKYISNERLLEFLNKIEEYLGETPTTSL